MTQATQRKAVGPPRGPEALGQDVAKAIDAYFDADPADFRLPAGRLPLAAPSYGRAEVKEAVAALLASRVTMGAKVKEFERRWAAYLGSTTSVMLNSGSSANLVALAALANPARSRPLRAGDEVITPAVTWSTTIAPIVQVGARPVLVDVDPHTFTMDVAEVRRAITPRTRALLPVHLLGNPAAMPELAALAEEHDLAIVEDCCEAHGAEIAGRKVGTFGTLGTYSFFFSHHISTIEGGAVNTDDPALAETLRALRAHGWIREREDREAVAARHPDLDPRFLFLTLGYNLRPTEMQGAFGVHQVGRLDGFVEARRANARAWSKALEPFAALVEVPCERPGTRHAWFGFPVLLTEDAPFRRADLQKHLEAAGIETRPVMSGNFTRHPAFRETGARVQGELPVASAIAERGFFFGNHHAVPPATREHVAATLADFLERHA